MAAPKRARGFDSATGTSADRGFRFWPDSKAERHVDYNPARRMPGLCLRNTGRDHPPLENSTFPSASSDAIHFQASSCSSLNIWRLFDVETRVSPTSGRRVPKGLVLENALSRLKLTSRRTACTKLLMTWVVPTSL